MKKFGVVVHRKVCGMYIFDMECVTVSTVPRGRSCDRNVIKTGGGKRKTSAAVGGAALRREDAATARNASSGPREEALDNSGFRYIVIRTGRGRAG